MTKLGTTALVLWVFNFGVWTGAAFISYVVEPDDLRFAREMARYDAFTEQIAKSVPEKTYTVAQVLHDMPCSASQNIKEAVVTNLYGVGNIGRIKCEKHDGFWVWVPAEKRP